MIEIIGGTALLMGAVIVLIGSVGLLRFPDFYCRLHSASVIDTLGSGLALVGMVLLAGSLIVAVKILMIGVLIFLLSPVVSHALAKAAVQSTLARPQQSAEQNQNELREGE